jgi:hypothetical protein
MNEPNTADGADYNKMQVRQGRSASRSAPKPIWVSALSPDMPVMACQMLGRCSRPGCPVPKGVGLILSLHWHRKHQQGACTAEQAGTPTGIRQPVQKPVITPCHTHFRLLPAHALPPHSSACQHPHAVYSTRPCDVARTTLLAVPI